MLDHRSWATACRVLSKYSTTIGTACPAVSVTVPVSTSRACFVHLSITSVPSTHSHTPSSDVVANVYVCEYRGTTDPLQRTENVSAPMPLTGAASPQSNAMLGSMRETVAPVRSALS